jgi:PTS system mannitol-specific IIA component/PTS system ascorbate-specific IIA component
LLKDIITIDDIEIGLQTTDWEDAVRKSSRRLLETGAIEEKYVDAIIQVVKETGPYFVLGNHIALAHTRPENGANKLGLSFTTLNPPINFGSENFDPIKLIITLSATDGDSHLSLMSDLASILMEEDTMEKLFNAKTKEDFYKDLMAEVDAL